MGYSWAERNPVPSYPVHIHVTLNLYLSLLNIGLNCYFYFINERSKFGVGEVIPWVRALAALGEDIGLILSQHGGPPLSVTPVPGVPCPLLASSGTRHACGAHIHIHVQTNTHA